MAQPSWKQERPVSAPAVRPVGCHLAGGLGAAEPYKPLNGEVGESGAGVGAAHTVPTKRGNARGGKEPHLVCGFAGGKCW